MPPSTPYNLTTGTSVSVGVNTCHWRGGLLGGAGRGVGGPGRKHPRGRMIDTRTVRRRGPGGGVAGLHRTANTVHVLPGHAVNPGAPEATQQQP